MGKDQANIFKLEGAEFKKYINEPFCDSFKSTKEFADALKRDIETKETPHVLLLEADFGMGKTFFSTRFTQYLRNEKIDAIYFSAWENDYLPEPFISFSKEIIQYINANLVGEKIKSMATNLFKIMKKVASSIAFSYQDPQTGICATISPEKLIEEFECQTDPVSDFKAALKGFIKKTKSKKITIIVDELDRCRPDYAMKVLECIKHFFDIEGLFIIIPTNKISLRASVKSLYNIENSPDDSKQCEQYHEKFFNDERKIKLPTLEDYRLIVEKHLNEKTLEQAILKNLITTEENLFNSINILVESCSNYCTKVKPTFRQLENYLKELCRMCCNFYEPVRAEWLAAVLLKRNENDTLFASRIILDSEHCYANKNHPKPNGIYKILEFNDICTKIINVISKYHSFNNELTYLLNQLKNRPTNNQISLEEADLFIVQKEELLSKIKKINPNDIALDLLHKKIMQIITQKKNEIISYRLRYGSDYQDKDRKLKYVEIAKNPEKLYGNYQDGKN